MVVHKTWALVNINEISKADAVLLAGLKIKFRVKQEESIEFNCGTISRTIPGRRNILLTTIDQKQEAFLKLKYGDNLVLLNIQILDPIMKEWTFDIESFW